MFAAPRWASAAEMLAAIRKGWADMENPPTVHSVEVPEFTAVTLRTAAGWTIGAATCSICAAIVLDRKAHRDWHRQFVHTA
jgi:hypothetical protein